MADNFQINEYETLPKEPLFKPEPPKSEVPSIGVGLLSNDMKRASQKLLPSERFQFGSSSLINKLGKDTRMGLLAEGPGREAYTRLSDGTLTPRFERFNPALGIQENEDLLARGQSASEKWGNGVIKLLGKTSVNVAGGLVGTVNGLIQGIRMQSLLAMYDNDISNYLEDANKRMDAHYANYRGSWEKDLNFGQKMGTANFWADDFLGGLSFLAGTIVSEGVWAAATGGVGLVARGAIGAAGRAALKGGAGKSVRELSRLATKEGKTLIRNTAKNSVDNLTNAGITAGQIQQGLNTARFVYTSAGYESGVEARAYMEEVEAQYVNEMLSKEGRMPTGAELGQFRTGATNGANSVFGANLALVGFSNFATLGKLLLGRGTTRKLSNSFFKKNVLGLGYKTVGGKKVALEATKFQKNFGKAFYIAKPAFTEGVIEEGGQASISKAASDYILSAYDTDTTNDNLSVIDALYAGVSETYTSKEGLTEVGLGALIGIFGGIANTRGKLNTYSSEQKRIKQSVDYVNQYTVDQLISHMKASNKVARAVKMGEKAKAEGNMTMEMSADTAAMTALAERAFQYQSTDELIEDFKVAMELNDDVKLAEEMGMSSDEVRTWKQEKFNEFDTVVKEHSRNLQFAEALLGDTNIAGLKNIEGFDGASQLDLQAAIAFSLTMGKRSDEFAESLATQIKQIVAKDLQPDAVTDAITVNSVLQKVGQQEQLKYNAAANKVSKIAQDMKNLEQQILKVQSQAEVGEKTAANSKANRLSKLNGRLVEMQGKMEEAMAAKTLAFDALNIPQFTEDIVTEEMLDNQAQNVGILNKTLNTIGLRNQEQGMALAKIMSEYERAVEQTKTYNTVIQNIINPKTRVSMLNGWASSIVNAKKKVNGDTAAMFINAIETYLNSQVNIVRVQGTGTEEAAPRSESKSESEVNDPLQEQPENIADEVNNKTVQPKPSTVSQKPVIEILKAKVKEIIQSDPYTNTRYNGNITDDLQSVKPTQEDVDRYNELLDKTKEGANLTTLAQEPYSKESDTGLSEAETAEFKNLNNKLNNWQILSGFNQNNSSIAEYLQIIDQLEKGFTPTPTQTATLVKDFFKPQRSVTKESSGDNTRLNTIVTPDISVAKKTGNNTELSHLKAESLSAMFPDSNTFVVQKGRKVAISSIPEAELKRLNQTPGTEFIVNLGNNDELKFTSDERQRLVVNTEELEAALTDSNIRILDFGNSNYMPVFIKQADGSFIPFDGDFEISSINENEVINLDKEALYDLEPGTILRTVVNTNDSFNSELIEQFRKGQITNEELINNLNIYVAAQGSVNDIVGTLRAIKPTSNRKTETFSKIYMIRKQAAKRALASTTPRVEVGITIPLGSVLIGSPNVKVVEDAQGELIPQSIDLTEEALSMVSDYGYILDGRVTTKNNLEYSKSDTIFARRASEQVENKGRRIPVVVFKHKNRTVVFPVSLKTEPGTRGAQVVAILNNSQISDAAKIYEINEILKKNNVDPSAFSISDLESEESVAEVNRMLQVLSTIPNYVDIQRWVEKNHNKRDLLSEVSIAIDITDTPFNAPKGLLDFNGISLPTEEDMEIEAVNTLDTMAKKIENIFRKENPFVDMVNNTKFYDAFHDVGIDMDAESYIMKKRNVNILIDSFNQSIPKSVKTVLGEPFITTIREEIKQYQVIVDGLKTNKRAINQELNSEIENLQNECK